MLPTVSSLERDLIFPPVPGRASLPDLPGKVVKDLSSDQHYGYRITKAIRSGKMDNDLAALTVGKTGHSSGSPQLTCSLTGGDAAMDLRASFWPD